MGLCRSHLAHPRRREAPEPTTQPCILCLPTRSLPAVIPLSSDGAAVLLRAGAAPRAPRSDRTVVAARRLERVLVEPRAHLAPRTTGLN